MQPTCQKYRSIFGGEQESSCMCTMHRQKGKMVRKGQYIWGNSVFEMSDSPYTLEQQAAEDHHEEDPPALEWEILI